MNKETKELRQELDRLWHLAMSTKVALQDATARMPATEGDCFGLTFLLPELLKELLMSGALDRARMREIAAASRRTMRSPKLPKSPLSPVALEAAEALFAEVEALCA